jgi:RNA binding exosome subunit
MATIQLAEKVSGFSERDLYSRAVLNTDTDGLLRYRLQKQKALRDNQSIHDIIIVKEELSSLKNELRDIKEMLLKITKEGK